MTILSRRLAKPMSYYLMRQVYFWAVLSNGSPGPFPFTVEHTGRVDRIDLTTISRRQPTSANPPATVPTSGKHVIYRDIPCALLVGDSACPATIRSFPARL